METKNNDIVESTLDESVYDTIVRAMGMPGSFIDARRTCHFRKDEDCLLCKCRQPRDPAASGRL